MRSEKGWSVENEKDRDRDVFGREKVVSGSENDSYLRKVYESIMPHKNEQRE
jgi:hypothetical protein